VDQLKDQMAFRPTGSTTGAMTLLLDKVTKLLASNPYVQVYALDFSKAFDTISHTPLLRKLSATNLPDHIYNWYCSFLSGRGHKTKLKNDLSDYKTINASVIQGSAMGPVAYIINASDLQPLTDGNYLLKYADDTYLIVPACNSHTTRNELENISRWANTNNLKLNLNKSKEIIFRKRNTNIENLPPQTPNVTRVNTINILGVTFDDLLNFQNHIDMIISGCMQNLYAIKILKSKGLSGKAIKIVTESYILNKITYALPAWWGFTNATDRQKLQAILNKVHRWGLDGGLQFKPLIEIVNSLEQKMFKSITHNTSHTL